jgi:hypothetical protein
MHMKNLILTLAILFFGIILNAQKVDIDNTHIYISLLDLPDNYTPVEYRTYTVSTNYSTLIPQDLGESLILYGWDRVEKNGNTAVFINGEKMYRGDPQLKSRVDETKDKNGKVISSKTYYWYENKNTGYGSMKVYGEKESFREFLYQKEKAARVKEKEKKKKDNEDKKEENPFLKNVDKNVSGELNSDVEVNINKRLAYNFSLNQEYTHSTSSYTSSNTAYKEFNDRSHDYFQSDIDAYRNSVKRLASGILNDAYGYRPVRNYVTFKKLDSEKHPEYKTFDNAMKAMQVIFGKMRYNLPKDEVENDLKPIIEYFSDLARKPINEKEKSEKKLRYAAFYNLAQIYMYLDRFAQVNDIADLIIKSEYKGKTGERFKESANNLQEELIFHKMTSRHLESLNITGKDDLGDEIKDQYSDDDND